MQSIAWLLILSAIVVARQVAVGRVLNVKEDLGDAFLAITRGDSAALTEVLSRKGDNTVPTNASVPIAGVAVGIAQGAISNAIAQFAVELGTKAKGYRWTATGPDYYDCSGLMWRACQKAGYKGSRFTTADVLQAKGMSRIDKGTVGDMVLWPAGSGGVTGHIGVITGQDEFYSARSVRSGIAYGKISTFRKPSPIYVHFTAT